MEIKFCENNFTFGTDETMKKLKENYPDVDLYNTSVDKLLEKLKNNK